ncbi:glycoside hydrolase family 127 protein [Actinoplanes sp. NPDC004185]
MSEADTGPSRGGPVAPSRGALRPVPLSSVRLAGGFWGERQAVNSTATLAHCRTWMDRLGWTGNFTAGPFGRRGREFADSEIYKLLEALCWDTDEHTADLGFLTGLVARAQAGDGYLSTAYGRPGQDERYSDLTFGHELYCIGHLLQAAVAAARTGRAPQLVEVARRAADHVVETFGPGRNEGVCGHPEIETALVELYRETGDRRYLDQASWFVDRRGQRSLPEHEFGWAYFQDDIPVRHAQVFRGHAVRALYLAAGAVDVAVETGDADLLAAVRRQFDRTLARRTYLTGGMGSRHLDESFGDDFVLPADRAYAETCAGVATIMLAHRLLLATGDTRYGDIVERVLYNVIATAVADDGRGFFYANTLHQRTRTENVPADREQLRFGGGPRAPWFEVSCCLPNLARLLAALETYLVTSDDGGVQLHQYADLDVSAGGLDLSVRTGYPDHGVVVVRVEAAEDRERTLTLRVPAWAGDARVVDRTGSRPVRPGPVTITRRFTAGEEICLELPLRPRWTAADPRVDAVRGCVAVEVGPLVMCAESVDLDPGAQLDDLRVDTTQAPQADAVKGWFTAPADAAWPYHGIGGGPGQPRTPRLVPLVPYHRWTRRGPTTMRVWLPTTPA